MSVAKLFCLFHFGKVICSNSVRWVPVQVNTLWKPVVCRALIRFHTHSTDRDSLYWCKMFLIKYKYMYMTNIYQSFFFSPQILFPLLLNSIDKLSTFLPSYKNVNYQVFKKWVKYLKNSVTATYFLTFCMCSGCFSNSFSNALSLWTSPFV